MNLFGKRPYGGRFSWLQDAEIVPLSGPQSAMNSRILWLAGENRIPARRWQKGGARIGSQRIGEGVHPCCADGHDKDSEDNEEPAE